MSKVLDMEMICRQTRDVKGFLHRTRSRKGKEQGIGLGAHASIYSGDCVPLTYKGVPSVTFMRGGGGPIHTHADTLDDVDGRHLAMLGEFILDFTCKMANAAEFPFPRDIPESIKKQTREYIENAGKVLEETAGKK